MKSLWLIVLWLLFVIPVMSSLGQMAKYLRKKRYLLYPDPKDSETKVQVLFGLGLPMEEEISMTLGYVLKCNYNLPYNSSHLYVHRRSPTSQDKPREGLTRWSLYRMMESTMEILGSGRVCLLRAICEAASNPLDEKQGLLAELLHLFLTPSSSGETDETYRDMEYRRAETIGRKSPGICSYTFHECRYNPLDYFSTVWPATYN